MKRHRIIWMAGAAVMLLAGCEKTPEPKTSTSAATAPSEGASVALPPEKLPPSDATLPPASAGVQESGKADTQSQANPAPLKEVQEKSSMPLTGQANNHSEPKALDTTK